MCIDPQREELIREELGRIVASDLFCRSDRLCRFLCCSVEQALRGESDRVKEYVVAVEAYGRPASFDSRADPVVRVEARRLRDRLKTWYEGEGRNARIRIDLPRGGYAALFHDPAAASALKHEPAPAQRTMAVLVGSSTGATARRLLLGLYPRFPSSCPVRSCRGPVSSARHIARSVRISRTTRSCTLHLKGYGTYPAGATADADSGYETRYPEKRPSVSYSHALLHRFQPKP